jgi:predicted alpha/beta hydrolase family esterase
MTAPSVLIVPGLRDDVPDHWQTWLATQLEYVRTVPPMGRRNLDLSERVRAVERAARHVAWPVIVVAHSAGAMITAHWAQETRCHVAGALLAVPPDFERAMPPGYPSLVDLRSHGWLPIPRDILPFPSIVAASRNDPLANYNRVASFARDWGSRLVDLGEVGHLNPASGFGEWPLAIQLIGQLAGDKDAARREGEASNRPDASSV